MDINKRSYYHRQRKFGNEIFLLKDATLITLPVLLVHAELPITKEKIASPENFG